MKSLFVGGASDFPCGWLLAQAPRTTAVTTRSGPHRLTPVEPGGFLVGWRLSITTINEEQLLCHRGLTAKALKRYGKLKSARPDYL